MGDALETELDVFEVVEVLVLELELEGGGGEEVLCWEVVGGGLWVVGEGGGGDEVGLSSCAAPPPPTSQLQESTPVPRGAKDLNRPSVRSRPPPGQPGHCEGRNKAKS